MRKLKKVVSALTLTVLLIAVTAVDGTWLTISSPDTQIGASKICAASLPSPRVRYRKAQYDDDGKLIGCFNKGDDCIVIAFGAGGEEINLLITSDGVHLR